MSLFQKFKDVNFASMICEKNEETGKYNCKMGYDCEANLFKNNKFEHSGTYSKEELEKFLINDLNATDCKDGIKRWVIMDNDHTNIYSFGNGMEIHVTKMNFFPFNLKLF